MLPYLTCVKRVRLRTITVSVILSSLLLLVYQIIISSKITNDDELEVQNSNVRLKQNLSLQNKFQLKVPLTNIRGALVNDKKYIPNVKGNIVCSMDSIEVDVSKINDDYCDCPADGMDEPGTNACKNGRFYCSHQPTAKHYTKSIPSSQVNDGICDCCDGSDEWNNFILANRLSDDIQRRLGRYQAPCSSRCT